MPIYGYLNFFTQYQGVNMLRTILLILSLYFTPSIFFPITIHAIAAEQIETKTTEADKKGSETTPAKEEPLANKDKSENPKTEVLRSNITMSAPIALIDQQQDDLEHYLSSKYINPILVGSDDYITIEQTSSTSNNKGVVIILPDWQQSIINPKAINYLRKQLPKNGWATITVQPPSKPENYPSQALTFSERLEENKKTLQQCSENLSALITPVMDRAKNYPGTFIVIAQGSHAAVLTSMYQQDNSIMPNALVILSGFMPTENADEQFAKDVAISTLPVLDLYLKRDHPLVAQSIKRRKQQTNKEMKTVYRQKELSNMITSYYPQEVLLKEINGWLKTIGW